MIITGGMTFSGGLNLTSQAVYYYQPETYSNSTVLLLQADKTFYYDDTSVFNTIITAPGLTSATSFVPSSFTSISPSDGSGSFPGNTYLLSTTNFLGPGAGNFTIECWFFPLAAPNAGGTFILAGSITGGFVFGYQNATTWGLAISGGAWFVTSTTLPTVNAWNHLSVTRNSGTAYLFLNGALLSSAASSQSFVDAATYIGHPTPANTINGYLSNLRIIHGRALYTGAFAVPSSALTTTPAPLDASNYSFELAASSYVSTPSNVNIFYGTADFTIECWFRLTNATSSYRGIWAQNNTILRFGDAGFGDKLQFAIDQSSVANIWSCAVTASSVLNTWTHVAWTRSNGVNRLYVNGVLQSIGSGANPATYPSTSFTNAGSITSGGVIGSLFVGQISNFRITNGHVVYSGNFTPPTNRLTTTQSTGTNNIFPITSLVQPYSVSFNGSSQYLTSSANLTNNFSTGNFTIECWVYFVSVANGQLVSAGTGTNTNAYYWQYYSGQLQFGVQNVGQITGTSWTPSVSTWYHIAVVRSGTNVYQFVNGTQLGTTATSSQNFVDGPTYVGYGGAGYLNGYLSNLRIVKDLAVYTGAFTLPTSRLTTTQSAGTNIAAITSSIVNYSVLFNGSSQYLSVPANAVFAFGTGDFTIEAWVNSSVAPGANLPIAQSDAVGSSSNNKWWFAFSGGGLFFGTHSSGGFSVVTTTAFSAGTWYHVAVTRASGVMKMFINGVSTAFATSGTPSGYSLSQNGITVGAMSTPSYWNGYISNLRIISGTAVYTVNFAVPTTTLPVIAGTSLLALKSATFVDNSVNAFTITPVGSPVINTFNPFGGTTVLLTAQDPIIQDNSSLASSITNTGAATTSTQNPFGSTALLTAQDTVIRDNSVNATVLTTTGGPGVSPLTPFGVTTLLTLQSNAGDDNNNIENFARIQSTSTLVNRFGTVTPGSFSPFSPTVWSNFFNTGDKLTFPSSSAFDLSGSTWTVEFWMYSLATATAGNACRLLMAGANGDAGGWSIGFGNDGAIGFGRPYGGSPTPINSPAGAIALNTWYHVAFVCNAGSARLYINGTQVTGPVAISLPTSVSQTLRIGYDDPGTVNFQYNGYISNLRIVKEKAIYTGNFTPPTSRLLTAKTTTDYSVLFNGSNYLSIASNTGFDFGSGDFTIEAWVFFTSFSAIYGNTIVSKGTVGDGTGPGIYSLQATSGGIIQFFFANGGPALLTGPTLSTNTWYHLAVTRSGSTFTLWVNGVSSNTATSSPTLSAGTPLIIGSQYYSPGATDRSLYGYASGLRIVKGLAVYTGNFTVPTAPLSATQSANPFGGINTSAITGAQTSLLTLQRATFVDNSVNAHTITPVGSPIISSVTSFGAGATTLLTAQSNRFIDNSINALAPTVTGTPVIAPFSPLPQTDSYNSSVHGSSLYFSGSNSYLNFTQEPNLYQFAGDFTVEAWVYSLSATGQANYSAIFDTRAANTPSTTGIVVNLTPTGYLNFYINSNNYTSATLLSANNWTHVALVRSGSTISMYQNGVSVASVSYATSLSSGYFWVGALAGPAASGYWQGYIGDLRAVNGAAIYTSAFTPPTLPLSVTAQTVVLLNGNSAGIIDSVGKNSLTTVGGAKLTHAVAKYGTGSITMTATGDYCVATQPSVASDINGGDFTIEFWVYFTSLAADRALISKYGNSAETAGGLGYLLQWIQASSVLRLVLGVGGGSDALYTWSWAPSISTWYHVAVTRAGTSGRAFINGTQIGSTSTLSTANFPSPNPVQIGKTHTTAQYLLGYMDDLRISRIARYTANFTAPTAALSTGTYIQIA